MTSRLKRVLGPALLVAVNGAASLVCALVAICARPGYESALVLAPVAALTCGLWATYVVVGARRGGDDAPARTLISRTLVPILAALGADLVILLAAGLLRGLCDPVQGLGFFAMGPLTSGLAAGLMGMAVALAVPGRIWPFVAWIGVLLMHLAWDAALAYFTPQVFVYDHLLGHFAGPLYDEDVRLSLTHLLFRLHTVARVALLVAVAIALHDPVIQRLRLSRLRRTVPLAWAVVTVAAFATTTAVSPACGLRTTHGTIVRTLGATMQTEHLTIHHPASLDVTQRELLAVEAEVRYDQLEEFFGGAPEDRLVIYVFPDAATMRRLTGTGPTSVAKPWLGATTIVYRPTPHPVLKHEMAHLFSAAWAPGPLSTPGTLWGLLADPLMLEGTAVAAEWDGDPLDPHTQAAALIRAGVIDDPASISGTGFFTHQGGVSYTLSGSFVRFLRDEHGAAAIRSWYSGEEFHRAFTITQKEALKRWSAYLETIPVPETWIAAMKLSYSQPSIFARPCPHQVANLIQDAGERIAAGEHQEADQLLSRACNIAPEDVHLDLARFRMAVMRGDAAAAQSVLQDLEGAALAEGPLRAKLLEASGDVAWMKGDPGEASGRYAASLALTAADEPRRLRAMKRWACTHMGASTELRDYLLGSLVDEPERGEQAVKLLRKLTVDHPGSVELEYLLARALYNVGSYQEAAQMFDRALQAPLPDPVIEGEARLMGTWAKLRGGDVQAASRALEALQTPEPASPALGFRTSELRAIVEAMD